MAKITCINLKANNNNIRIDRVLFRKEVPINIENKAEEKDVKNDNGVLIDVQT